VEVDYTPRPQLLTITVNNGHTNGAMIEVENLTKRYAGARAVAGVSFTVGRGEIVGLLGPNGAGKSTIMRILSCFMPATSGSVRVAGYDVFTQVDEVRRRIGYMPENNPLHRDMRVKEYLRFRSSTCGTASLASSPRAFSSAWAWPTRWCMIRN
jgi:ABC-type multidrug transport system ATPase subunit